MRAFIKCLVWCQSQDHNAMYKVGERLEKKDSLSEGEMAAIEAHTPYANPIPSVVTALVAPMAALFLVPFGASHLVTATPW